MNPNAGDSSLSSPFSEDSSQKNRSMHVLSLLRESLTTQTGPSGLWPSSITLAEYEKLSPGIAKIILDTIIRNFSEEANQRRENERIFVNALTKAIGRGQYYALASVLITTLLGAYLAWLRYPWASSVIVGLDLALLVGAFVRSSVRTLPQSREPAEGSELPSKPEGEVPRTSSDGQSG